MPIPYVPLGTPTDVCSGITQYNDARPPATQSLINGQITVFAMTAILGYGALPFAYCLRNEPMFDKVRPFTYSVAWVTFSSMWLIAAQLQTIASSFPCALEVFLYCFALTGCAIVVFLRALILTVETLYSKRVTAEKTLLYADDVDTKTSSTSQVPSLCDKLMKFIHIVKIMSWIGLGRIEPESLVLSQLIAARSSYISIGILMTLPAIVCFIILVAAFPPLAQCDCRDAVFLEIPIGLLIAISCDVCIVARTVHIAWKVARKVDEKGVIIELFGMALIPAPLAMVTWALVAIDPGELAYHRIISWFYGTASSSLAYWVFVFGYPFWQTFRARNKAREVATPIPPLQETLSNDDVIRDEFEIFAERHLVIESVRFLQDVTLFRTYFREKDNRWRRLKAKQITTKYLHVGALLEINVSSTARNKCIHLVNEITASNEGEAMELFDAFDACEHEVTMMLTGGPWMDFIVNRRRNQSKVYGKMGGAVVQAV